MNDSEPPVAPRQPALSDEADRSLPIACRIQTGSRLHFGLLSVNNPDVPAYGGVGLMLDDPRAIVEVRRSDRPSIDAPRALLPRIREWLARLTATDERIARASLQVRVSAEIPPHAGFGSGTQTSLALTEAVRRVCGLPFTSPWEVARGIGRARRSAIGVAGYLQGGLIVDAGHRPDEPVGEIVVRSPLPEEWRVVLVESPRTEGLSGTAEGTAFDRLPPLPRETTERLCGLIVLELLPALITGDCRRFVCALVEYGRCVGEYFAREQGGTFASPAIARCHAALQEAGWPGLAQSSWGPTSATLVPDEDQAGRLTEIVRGAGGTDEVRVRVVSPLNEGRSVRDVYPGDEIPE